MNLGEFLKCIRLRHSMTQAEFGDITGRNKDMVSKWENGIAMPSTDELYEISNKLKEPVLMLVTYGVLVNNLLEIQKRHN